MTPGPGVLDPTDRLLTAIVRAEQVSGRLPSLVAGVVRDGDLVWSTAHGSHVQRDDGPAPSVHTQFRIGSITKTMTALLVMQLRDEGRLSLADRLDQHVPGTPYGDRSLRQLLSHQSGLPAEPPGPWWERAPGRSFDELVSGLDPAASAGLPDVEFHYSNLAYALLGELVARLTEMPWAQALESRLLTPLGMRRTGYHQVEPAAAGFSVHPFAGTLTDEPSHDSGALAPAGQLWSTVHDLTRYATFLADPDPAVITADTLAEMTVVHAGTPDNALEGAYGLGLRIAVTADRTYVGHTGSMPGFVAGLFVDRARRTAAVCLANGATGMRAQGLPIQLLEVLQQHEPWMPAAWVPAPAVAQAVLDVLGLWHWGNTALTISYDGAGLVSRILGSAEPWCTYRPDGADRFRGTSGYHKGETLRLLRRGDGTVSHVECATFVFTRSPYDPTTPIPGGS